MIDNEKNLITEDELEKVSGGLRGGAAGRTGTNNQDKSDAADKRFCQHCNKWSVTRKVHSAILFVQFSIPISLLDSDIKSYQCFAGTRYARYEADTLLLLFFALLNNIKDIVDGTVG